MRSRKAGENDGTSAFRPLDGFLDLGDNTDIEKVVIQRFVFKNIFLSKQKNSAISFVAESNIDCREGRILGAKFHTKNGMRKSRCSTKRDNG